MLSPWLQLLCPHQGIKHLHPCFNPIFVLSLPPSRSCPLSDFIVILTRFFLSCLCSFQDFDLQGSHRCNSDWMSISSYRSLDGLRVCGSSLPPPYISSQDHVWIHFHSDDTLTGKGFRLSYISGKECGIHTSLCGTGDVTGFIQLLPFSLKGLTEYCHPVGQA